MPVPSSLNDLSTTAGANSPSGSETPGQGDDYLRVLSAFLAQIRDKLNGTSDTGTIKNPVFSGTSTGTLTLAGATLPTPIITGTPEFQGSAVNWAATTTHDGAHVWSGAQTYSAAAVFNGSATFNGGFTAAGLPTSGTYTPTLAAVANVSSTTAGVCNWMRVGNIVLVTGSASATPTASGVATQFSISLPVASTLASGGGLSGAVSFRRADMSGSSLPRITFDTSPGEAVIDFTSNGTAAAACGFSFSYEVV